MPQSKRLKNILKCKNKKTDLKDQKNNKYEKNVKKLEKIINEQKQVIDILLIRINSKYKQTVEYNKNNIITEYVPLNKELKEKINTNNICSVCFLHVTKENEVIDHNNNTYFHNYCIN